MARSVVNRVAAPAGARGVFSLLSEELGAAPSTASKFDSVVASIVREKQDCVFRQALRPIVFALSTLFAQCHTEASYLLGYI